MPIPTSLLLVLLPAFASTVPASLPTLTVSIPRTDVQQVRHMQAATPRVTTLPAIKVRSRVGADTNGASLAAYGRVPLRDTPAAVTVITHAQLADHHVRSLRELVTQDAALGDDYAAIGYYQNITIRGFPLDLATGYRIDNLTVVGEQRVGMADVQRVEILKGLAGIDAGVMEPGGVVNYVTKRPADVRTLTVGTDSHGSRYTALDVGKWITPDFGVRANVAWNQVHSFVRHADGRRNFYSLAADWQVAPGATLEFDGDYAALAQRSVSGYQLLGGTTLPRHASATRMLGHEPWQRPVRFKTSNSSVHFNANPGGAWQIDAAAGHSRSVIDDNVAFAYGCFYVPQCITGGYPGNYFAPNGDYDIYEYRSPDDTRSADQARVALIGSFDTGSVHHAVSVGASAFRRTIDRRLEVYDYVGSANIADVEPPYFPTTGAEPGPSSRRLTDWQHTLFALDRMHLGAHWQAIIGSHFVHLHERAWDATGVKGRDTRMGEALPQAAVLWQPVAPLTVYTSYAKGLSLGEQAPYWASNGDAFLGPRRTRQVELGAKYELRGGLRLDASLYRIREPYQYARPDATAAGFTFVQQGSEVHTGFELGAHGQLTPNLRIDASASFIRARVEDTGTPTYAGHQVVNVPKLRTVLNLDYRVPALPALTLFAGWRHASVNTATPDGSARVPAWDVFDAGLRYTGAWGRRRVTWRLGVSNLFNRFYWRDTGSSLGDNYLFPGAPRLARLTMTVDL